MGLLCQHTHQGLTGVLHKRFIASDKEFLLIQKQNRDRFMSTSLLSILLSEATVPRDKWKGQERFTYNPNWMTMP